MAYFGDEITFFISTRLAKMKTLCLAVRRQQGWKRQRRQIDIHRLSSNILILLIISEKPSRIIKMLIMVGSKLPE